MRSAKQETVADIVARMRDEAHAGDASCLEWVGAKIRHYADRIEAAAKREREAGAEAAQVCGEIGEMIGRESARMSDERTAEKYSAVGNAAKMREALEAVVKVGYPHNFQKESPHIRGYCHEITTAIKKCFDALSSPPRNCDRHECATTKAAQDVWRKEDGGKTAYYEWLLATYMKGGAK